MEAVFSSILEAMSDVSFRKGIDQMKAQGRAELFVYDYSSGLSKRLFVTIDDCIPVMKSRFAKQHSLSLDELASDHWLTLFKIQYPEATA